MWYEPAHPECGEGLGYGAVGSTPTQGEESHHYVIKFISDLQQVHGFLWVLQFPSFNKTDSHDIAEILKH